MAPKKKPPQVAFGTKFVGPAMKHGKMPAQDLAESLLAITTLIDLSAAIHLGGPDQVEVTVNADFRRSSFIVDLSVVSWVKDALSHVTPGTLKDIVGAVLGSSGLVGLLQFLRGKEPRGTKVRGKKVTVYNDLSQQKTVTLNVYVLAGDPDAIESVQDLARVVGKPGVEGMETKILGRTGVSIRSGDLPALLSAKPVRKHSPAGQVLRSSGESLLELRTASFERDLKTYVRQGKEAFSVSIEDQHFWDRVEAGEAFAKGDVLRVDMEVTMTREGSETTHLERRVTRVIEKIPAKSDDGQGSLF